MNLGKKKTLAARVLGVGNNRILFNIKNLNEIKEAITREDIRGLADSKIILIKPVKGRKKIKRKKTKRGSGKIKKKVNIRKKNYVKLTRKLRKYLKELKSKGLVGKELYLSLRKRIRAKDFKSKASLKEQLKNIGTEVRAVENKKTKSNIKRKEMSKKTAEKIKAKNKIKVSKKK